MFHWICPECGREIPPAVRECPACDPQSKQNSEASSPAAEIRAETAQPGAVTSPAPVLSNKEPVSEPQAALEPAKAEPQPGPDPLLALAEQIRAAQSAQSEIVPTNTVQTESVVTETVPAMSAAVAGLAGAVGLSPEPAVEAPAPAAADIPAQEPLIGKQDVEAEPATALLAQPVALLAPPVEQPAEAPAALADSLPAVLPKPAVPASASEPGKIEAAPPIEQAPPLIRETPADKPPSGSWLRLAPLQDYSAAASRGMHPVVPLPKILMPDSGPRITLPGPLLPPELQMRKNLHVVTTIGGAKKRKPIAGWMVSAMVIAVMLGAGILVTQYVLPASHTAADAKATPAPNPVETAAPVESSHPLAEYVEVTGFRFIMDLNKKSEVHYLVVNHSPSELTDMMIFVTVKAASARPGQAPLCRFAFRSPGLGPFESREMVSLIEKLSRPVALPDWHDLKAEVQISQ